MNKRNVIIIGSGPAGYTAAIYAARANLSPLLFSGFFSGPEGGQLTTTTDVENYPGFPSGILGPDMMQAFKKQAMRFGTEIRQEDVLAIKIKEKPFIVETKRGKETAHTIIIATGAVAKRLDIPGTKDGQLWQKGVSSCAVCDGAAPIFRKKKLYVIGGGDSAVEEAIFLTKYAEEVYIVHRRNQLRASKIMADRACKHPKITILWNSVLTEVRGKDLVESVCIQNVETKKVEEKPAAGVFFAIGHSPNTAFLEGQLPLTESGYIVVEKGTSKTSIPGIFAAGDVQDPLYRQAITAAGSGCMAALDAERFLSETVE